MLDVLTGTPRRLERTKQIANFSMFAAAIIISLSIYMSQHFFPYFLFLISHVLWAICAHAMKERKLFQLNFFFIFLDTFAVSVRMIN